MEEWKSFIFTCDGELLPVPFRFLDYDGELVLAAVDMASGAHEFVTYTFTRFFYLALVNEDPFVYQGAAKLQLPQLDIACCADSAFTLDPTLFICPQVQAVFVFELVQSQTERQIDEKTRLAWACFPGMRYVL